MANRCKGTGMERTYDVIDPVATFADDVGSYISTRFIMFRDAKFHSDDDCARKKDKDRVFDGLN